MILSFVSPLRVQKKSSYFVTCKNSFQGIEGVPFIQQDLMTGRCAHACLSMISKTLSLKAGNPFLTFKEIRELVGNTHTPASGLNFNEAKSVIKGMDCSPQSYDYSIKDPSYSPYEPEEIIYQYIESQIPVYVGLRLEDGGHSIVVIGHTFDSNAWWPEASGGYYKHKKSLYFKSPIFTDFIIQDDNFGPYLTIPRGFFSRENVSKIIVPLSEPLSLLAEEVEDYIVFNYLTNPNFLKQMKIHKTHWTDSYLHHFSEHKLLLRTLLIERDEFINSIKNNSGAKDIKTFHTNSSLFPAITSNIPKFWLIEISIPEFFTHKHYRVGEVIINPYEKNWLKSILSIHLPNVLFAKNPEGGLEEYLIKDDVPYEIVRSPRV
ncbi:MAG: papain-like cysteine protease family protein [bacterium]|nr:papain-like cysteine protease family protein [bacterium]